MEKKISVYIHISKEDDNWSVEFPEKEKPKTFVCSWQKCCHIWDWPFTSSHRHSAQPSGQVKQVVCQILLACQAFHLATCSSFPCTLTHPMGPSPFRDWLIRLPVFVFGSQPLLTSHYHPTSTIHHPPTTTNNEPLPPSASPPIFMSYICTYDNSPFASPVGSLVYSTLPVSRAAGKSMPNIYIYVYIHRMVWHK